MLSSFDCDIKEVVHREPRGGEYSQTLPVPISSEQSEDLLQPYVHLRYSVSGFSFAHS